MSDAVMDVFFCDLCNESIPQADLDQGRAVRRNERLICAACEAAMSGGHARPAGAPALPPAALAPRASGASPGSPSVLAVALAFASVALVVAVGAGAYLFWHFEQRSRALEGEIAEAERAAPEHARTVSAALVEEASERENELAQAGAELQGLAARVQGLERSVEKSAGLSARMDKLDERLAALDDLASRVEHQSGALDQLSLHVAQLAAEGSRREEARKPVELPSEPKPSNASATPPTAPGGALWQNWVADLASPNSGTRWQAVQSLGGTGDAAVVPHLVPMLEDTDLFVRMAAARILGDLGSVEAIPALIDALEDEESSVREAALVSLRGLSGQSIPFDPLAREGDRAKRVKAWRDWWEQTSKELLGGKKPKG